MLVWIPQPKARQGQGCGSGPLERIRPEKLKMYADCIWMDSTWGFSKKKKAKRNEYKRFLESIGKLIKLYWIWKRFFFYWLAPPTLVLSDSSQRSSKWIPVPPVKLTFSGSELAWCEFGILITNIDPTALHFRNLPYWLIDLWWICYAGGGDRKVPLLILNGSVADPEWFIPEQDPVTIFYNSRSGF